jgi:hypothetical protein
MELEWINVGQVWMRICIIIRRTFESLTDEKAGVSSAVQEDGWSEWRKAKQEAKLGYLKAIAN